MTTKTKSVKDALSPNDLRPGQTVKIHHKIKEVNAKGEMKERLQIFEGVILARRHGNEPGATFTVRKISEGVGVEKIFPLHSPIISRIELVKESQARRAKLGFLRDPNKKLKEKK